MSFKIIAVIIVLVGILLLVASMKPDTFRYERTVTINAPASVVFAQIQDFHKWEAWSPWEKLDPNVKRTYSGADAGVGAKYAWQGNKNVGSGTMEITEIQPEKLVRIRLEFTTPMPAVNTTDFLLEEKDGSAVLTQAMYGKNLFMGKVMSIFMNMDNMIGSQFEKGLADIKRISESA